MLDTTTFVGDDKVEMEYEYEIIKKTRQTEKVIITRKHKLSVALVFQGNPI